MRVLVACGGTGGHILPALSFLEQLKSRHDGLDVAIVVTKRKIEDRIVPAGCRVFRIDASAVKFWFDGAGSSGAGVRAGRRLVLPATPANLAAIARLLAGAVEGMGIILRFRPHIVVGFGSYASFSLVLFAKLLGIKTIIHEQNAAAGTANRLLARFADKIAISFDVSRECFKRYAKRVVLTGNPKTQDMIKVDRRQALKVFGFREDKFTVLVMGGSQGSSRINRVFIESLRGARNKDDLQVVHLCGGGDFGDLSAQYQKTGVAFKLYEFFEPMHYAYAAADLAITRAGATTISELIFFSLPAVVIPYPLARGHQAANAALIVENKAAILIEDSALDAGRLGSVIECLRADRGKVNAMREAYGRLRPAAGGQDLAQVVLSLKG